MPQANCVAKLMWSALWLMHKSITWRRFCAVAMWYAGPTYLCTTAVSLSLLSWIKNFPSLVRAWRCELKWRENACCLTANHHFIYPLTGLIACEVKDFCRFGHPQDNGGGKKKVNCCPEAYFIYLESWWCFCSFSILRDSNKSWSQQDRSPVHHTHAYSA